MKMELKTDLDDGPYIEVSEAYGGFTVKTDAGRFHVCHRDSGIEIRLENGPWWTWQGPAGPLCLEDLGLVSVPKDNLRMLASFECEHGEHDSCDTHGEVCNSCRARRFAHRYLGREKKPPSKEPEPPDDGSKPLGSLDRFRHG